MTEPKMPRQGRFEGATDGFAHAFGASLPVDRRLWAEDIAGSIAHARMLAATGVISDADAEAIETGLRGIAEEISSGDLEWDPSDEDVHMAIERALTERIGEPGKRLHTARSRNDQVATDMRMYAKAAALRLLRRVCECRGVMIRSAEEHLGVVMPGYTHLQKAQPVLFSHHVLAYSWMLVRDAARLRHAHEAADVMPLGSAALAGTAFPIDRRMTAESLGFARIAPNSMDAVSDRDFLFDLVYACAMVSMHLSRLMEEIVLWSSEEFGYVALDDAWATGSSIMPQKRNPDFAELVRGKTGRVYGDLTALLTVMKGLPLTYDKDMQEDKEPVFDAVDTVADCLVATAGMLSTMRVDAERMALAAEGGFMAATDLADHLASRGVPFREAHEVVGRIVLACERHGKRLRDLSVDDLKAADARFGHEAAEIVEPGGVASRRESEGGTGDAAVARQLRAAREALAADEEWCEARGA